MSPEGATTLAEGESARVPAGGTIRYTALAAGCMAVTVHLTGGGGAGVHLTIQPYATEDTAEQLRQFRDLIGATVVTRVAIVCDAYNNWFFEFGYDDDFMPQFLASAPRGVANGVNPDGARYATADASARAWGVATFGCADVTATWSQAAGPYQFAAQVVAPVVVPAEVVVAEVTEKKEE